MALPWLLLAFLGSAWLPSPILWAVCATLAILHLVLVLGHWPGLSAAWDTRLRMLPGLALLLAFFLVQWYLTHATQLSLVDLLFKGPDADDGFLTATQLQAVLATYFWFWAAALLVRARELPLMWRARTIGDLMLPYARIVGLQITIGLVAAVKLLGFEGAALYAVLAVAFFPWHLIGIRIRLVTGEGRETDPSLNQPAANPRPED